MHLLLLEIEEIECKVGVEPIGLPTWTSDNDYHEMSCFAPHRSGQDNRTPNNGLFWNNSQAPWQTQQTTCEQAAAAHP